jgi:glycine/D-amino acid oxidase-like deaminating enzyme
MTTLKTDAVICGAGIAGISAAYHLAVQKGITDIILVDERPPMTLTSDKSTECYRNWWPGPDDTMVGFMNHSIDLLEKLAAESDNYFHMNRRGYVFLTGDSGQAEKMKQTAEAITQLGAGPLRCHYGRDDDPVYPSPGVTGYDSRLDGADFVLDRSMIRKHFPFVTDRAIAMLHVRRCGWLSAQQLGMYMLDKAKAQGVRFLNGRVSGVSIRKNRIETIQIDTNDESHRASTRTFIVAAGPFLKNIGAMIGVDFPVFNELHGSVAFSDPQGVISRDAPLMVWEDPVAPYWSDDERTELASTDETRWLTERFPGGVHFRPEGGPDSHTVLALWTYDIKAHEPVWPPVFKDEYAEIVVRGLARMIPGLIPNLERLSPPVVDGGYYCKTEENRPLIGPLPPEGAYVIAALSGFGIMAGMAAGELLANHVTGGGLPRFAANFLLTRYQDPAYRKLLKRLNVTSGQL